MATFKHHVNALSSAPSSQLANAVLQAVHDDPEKLFLDIGSPGHELTVTPYSHRASLLAAAKGRGFFPHELRVRIPMPEGLEPEIDVWDDGTTPVWRNGILTEPKYFSFFQDSPHAAFNPNYRHQWRAHELLHGVVGFFFRPDMTRFEFYHAARVNELLPVVHWYGLDEVFRRRCDAHRDQTYIREFCPECERLAFSPNPDLDETRAARFIDLAREHFAHEMDALERERLTGRPVTSPIAHIDASSDAIGYLHGHWARCTAWSFGTWVERFLVDGHDYESTCAALQNRVQQAFDDLVAGEIVVNLADFERLSLRRKLQDYAYRTLLVIEGLPESYSTVAEEDLEPGLSALEQACHQLLTSPGDVLKEDVNQMWNVFRTNLEEVLPDDADAILSAGYLRTETSNSQLVEGLRSAFPVTSENLGERIFTIAEVFVENPIFFHSERLDQRFAEFLPDADEDAAKLAEFEVWANEPVAADEEAELFGAVPEDVLPEPGTLRLNKTFRRRLLPGYVMHHVFQGERAQEMGTILMRGQRRFCALDRETSRILDAVTSDDVRSLNDPEVGILFGLIEEGFVVWLPKPMC